MRLRLEPIATQRHCSYNTVKAIFSEDRRQIECRETTSAHRTKTIRQRAQDTGHRIFNKEHMRQQTIQIQISLYITMKIGFLAVFIYCVAL